MAMPIGRAKISQPLQGHVIWTAEKGKIHPIKHKICTVKVN